MPTNAIAVRRIFRTTQPTPPPPEAGLNLGRDLLVATWSSGRIRLNTLLGLIFPFHTSSISSGRKRRP